MIRFLFLLTLVLVLAACSSSDPVSQLNRRPTVDLTASLTSSTPSMSVDFHTNAHDEDGDTLTYTWNFGDGKPASEGARTSKHDYLRVGRYNVSVTVSDGELEASDSIEINVLEPRYYGEWGWVAMFSAESYFVGYFSVSLTAPDHPNGSLKDASGGLWTWCDEDGTNCNKAGGGVVGTFSSNAQSMLGVSFFNSDSEIKLIAADSDGVIGSEASGRPTFSGAGEWHMYSGEVEPVGFAMSKLSSTPVIQPQTAVKQASFSSLTSYKLSSQSVESDLQLRALRHLQSKFEEN